MGVTRRFEAIIGLKQVVKKDATRIPTFYAAIIGSNSLAQRLIMYLVSWASGWAHSIVSDFSQFPTLMERFIWHISVITTFIIPLIVLFVFYFSYRFRTLIPIAKFTIPLLLGTYILARVMFLVLGFTTLRDLPPGALDTIHWPNFNLIFVGN